MSLAVATFACAALAHPGGYTSSCNPGGYTVPISMPRNVLNETGNIECVEAGSGRSDCVLSINFDFQGFLISSEASLSPTDTNVRSGHSENCLTHSSSAAKREVRFQATGTAAVYAIIVRNKIGVTHNVYTVPTALTRTPNVYVVGGGPGGIAAARYLESVNVPVTVFERGPAAWNGFYNGPIRNTSLSNLADTYKYRPLGPRTNPELASFEGGNMNANGAILSPGSPQDLARSTGVTLEAAVEAQEIAASYVDVEDDFMMWSCINNSDCNRAMVVPLNSKMARRSVAYNHGLQNFQVLTEVASVTDSSLTLNNGIVIALNSNDKVIVAAGALKTPALLGKTEYCGWTHYYETQFEARQTPPARQTISYNPSTKIETNVAQFEPTRSPDNVSNTIIIEMLMEHNIRECFRVGQSFTPSRQNDAWHYAGTLDHDRMKYSDGIFVGDASALKSPFACHTSMPAAATGILAAQRALGTQHQPPISNDSSGLSGLGRVGVWFSVGSFVLVIAVIAHFLSLWKTHYILASIAVVLITVGVVLAASGRGYVKNRHSAHSVVGYIVIVWLWLQALFGYVITQWSIERKKMYGWLHRVSAILLFILITYLFSTVAFKEIPFAEMAKIGSYSIIATVLFVLFILLDFIVSWRLRSRMQSISTATLLKERLMEFF